MTDHKIRWSVPQVDMEASQTTKAMVCATSGLMG
jgi:hypothetical protein